MRRVFLPALALIPLCVCSAQTTQGVIAGRVLDSAAGEPVPGAVISYQCQSPFVSGTATGDSKGYYRLPPLPPGIYHIRAAASGYQPADLFELEVRVAGRLSLDLPLRRIDDVWDSGRYRSVVLPGNEYIATLYGPDVRVQNTVMTARSGEQGAPEAAVSQAIDPEQIGNLPLAGRDVYTGLVTQPGVTAEAATTRSLSVSVNGQRPSASNFMLDGIQENNQLLSGPGLTIAPEAVQEYRVSVADFSAEIGGTSGYTANAITLAGGPAWHGSGYFFLMNEALNANSFQNNRLALPRPVAREIRPGVQGGGPILKDLLHVAASLENLGSHGHSPATEVTLPAPSLVDFTAPDSIARRLLTRFPTPAPRTGPWLTARMWYQPPVTVRRTLGLGRADLTPAGGKQRGMVRVSAMTSSRPDFIWSPYEDFQSGLSQDVFSGAFAWTSLWTPRLFGETRAGFLADNLGWSRAHPEIPTLADASPEMTILPGSLAFYSFSNRQRVFQLQENLSWNPGRHGIRFGGGGMFRSAGGALSAGQDGRYSFPTVVDFAVDQPARFSVSLDRLRLPALTLPDSRRNYRINDSFLYVQYNLQQTRRLNLHAGLRWERFGTPSNQGPAQDVAVSMGPGATLPQRLIQATVAPVPLGDGSIFGSHPGRFAPRAGIAYDLTGSGRTTIRAAWGLFHDRPFDNLWLNVRNNGFVLGDFEYVPASGSYLKPVPKVLPYYEGQTVANDFPVLTSFDQNWLDGSVSSYFAAIQHRLRESWMAGITYLGSSGKHIISTDIVNRPFTVPPGPSSPDGSLNPALPQVSYRTNQATSSYHGLAASVSHRSSAGQLHLSGTWGHSIDNQSDPLAGDFFDLNFARISGGGEFRQVAAFSRQFSPDPDRADSDFDQRWSFVVYSLWNLPAPSIMRWLLKDWHLAELAAVRAGFPYSVFAPAGVPRAGGTILNNRADLTDPKAARADLPVGGGRQLLDAAGFQIPPGGRIGSGGRNAFRSPGFFSLDLSLSRSFALGFLGESGRLVLRADSFNAINHTNLGQPDSFLGSPSFGTALFGRTGKDSGFPVTTPFRETARQFLLSIRIQF